jgi:hypothetical protein
MRAVHPSVRLLLLPDAPVIVSSMCRYKSKSKDLQNIVGMTLSQGKKQFRRVRRGFYALKG